jgi:hypothetical protein
MPGDGLSMDRRCSIRVARQEIHPRNITKGFKVQSSPRLLKAKGS